MAQDVVLLLSVVFFWVVVLLVLIEFKVSKFILKKEREKITFIKERITYIYDLVPR